MSVREMKELRRALDEHVERFDGCMKTTPSCRLLRTYVAGQLGTLPRKSVEPIAEEAGIPPRTLQQFLGLHRWDDDSAWRRLRELVREDHGAVGDIGVVDETGYVKAGEYTAGVQRQYCGAVGKVDNCVVSVGLVYASLDGSFHAAIANDLFLPKSWADDRERCHKAGIPDEVLYRPKWKIAVDQILMALAEGVPLSWITADEGYGRFAEFRNAVADAQCRYVLEIPSNLMGWTVLPEVEAAGTVTARGRKLKKDRVPIGEPAARTVNALWKRGGPSWTTYRIKDGEKGPTVWTVRETPFYPREKKLPGPQQRLVVARNVLSGERKYFLSNAASDVPLRELLHVAFSRWHVEQVWKEQKSEIGLDHFEVRNYLSLKRHLLLSAISLYFLVEQTLLLQEKNPLWTLPQVKMAVEAQLEPNISGRELTRRLVKVSQHIAYHQRRNAEAAACHDATRRRALHEAGVDLRRAARCAPA